MNSRYLAKDAAEVSTADFADILRREALEQHFADNRMEKSSRQSWPSLVGALANTRGKQISVAPYANVVHAHRVHHRLDAFHEFFQRVRQVSPHPDHAARIATTFACSLLINRGFIISTILGLPPVRLSKLVCEIMNGCVATFNAPSTVS